MKKLVVIFLLIAVVLGGGMLLIPKGEKEDAKSSSAANSTPQEKSYVRQLAESMTLEEKVGQMFLVCVSNSTISTDDIASYGLGGYLFFADFFETRTPESVKTDIQTYQKSASIPMLMAVDEEGGSVVRVSKYSAYRDQPFASPQEIYEKNGLDGIKKDTEEKADLLLSMGLNVNLAPVCDITSDKGAFIYPRTLGQDEETTCEYVSSVVSTMNEKKIGCALKHFPGYGGNADTHTGTATDTRSYETFASHDFLPFQAGIDTGARCVLVNHNIISAMDPEKPASLSKKVHQILRDDLGFEGVIMTDDLVMEGVQGYSGKDNIAVAAVKGGNDLLCTSGYAEQIPALVNAVLKEEISEEQITNSVIRILEWKEELGLLDQKRSD